MAIREAEGLLLEEWDGVEPGKGTSRELYEEAGGNIVGKG